MRDGCEDDEEKEEIIAPLDWLLCLVAVLNAMSDKARAAKFIKDMFNGLRKD